MDLSSNVIGDSNDETNFQRKLLFAYTEVSKFCKDFENLTCFDSFEVEYTPKEIKKYELRGKSLLDYTNLLSTNEYKKNDKMKLKHLK